MKKLAVAAGVVSGIIILLALLPFAIDLNRHKGAILERMKTVTARQVDFDGIRLTILSGLGAEITGLRIADDPAYSRDSFLTLQAAGVKVALLPLLKREIRIRKVVLEEPQIFLIKNRQGVFNFTTLLLPKPGRTEAKPPKPGALASLLISNVKVTNGVVSFRDDMARPGGKPFTISDIDLEASDMSFAEPVSFSLAAAVMSDAGQNMNMTGTIGPMPEEGGFALTPLEVHVLVDPLPLGVLPVKLPVSSGTMKADISFKGTLKDRIDSRAVLDLAGLVMGGKGTAPAKGLKGIDCSLASNLVLELSRERLALTGGTFTLGSGQGTFEGTVTGLKKAPLWNITVKSQSIAPGPVLEQLPMFASLIPAKLTVNGPAGFTLVTKGTKEAFELNTRVDMRPTAIAFGRFFNKASDAPFTFAGTMKKGPEALEIVFLDFDLGAIRAKGSGEVRTVADKSRFEVRIDTDPVPLQTAQALIPMLQAFKPSGNVVVKTRLGGGGGNPLAVNVQAASERMGLVLTKPKEGEQPKARVLSGQVKADMNAVSITVDALKKEKALTASGSVKSRGGTFMGVPYATLTSAFSLADDKLTVSAFDLTALKGSIRGSASYNLKSKAWTAAPVFTNVQAGNILDTLTNFKGVFAGTVTGDLKAGGVAGQPALNTLLAQGNLSISRGEWKNFDLAGTVLGSILGVPGASEIFGFAPAEVQRYNTTRFESLNTSIDLSKKVINVDAMQLLNISSGKDVDTESSLKGTISMETNEVRLKGNVVLPKRFSQRIGAKAEAFSAIMDDQKRLVLPMTITGSVKKPVPMVQVSALSSAFTKYYATRALDKGMKKLQDKGKLPAGSDETRRAIDNALEGLFRKKK